jgi:biopolymer transport protein ExbB/TolQ
MNFLHLIQTGGFVMYPLIIFSVIAWAIFFERIWFLHQFQNNFRSLNKKVQDFHSQGKKQELRGFIEEIDNFLKVAYLSLLSTFQGDEKHAEQHRRLQEVYAIQKHSLWALATIASASPFVGLFGTVTGIIRSFSDIARTGKGGFTVVAAGLSEALIATATGIIVAVVAVLIYNYLLSKINRVNLEFKNKFLDIAAQIKE